MPSHNTELTGQSIVCPKQGEIYFDCSLDYNLSGDALETHFDILETSFFTLDFPSGKKEIRPYYDASENIRQEVEKQIDWIVTEHIEKI